MAGSAHRISVLAPTFEHHYNGFGVQSSQPRISWRFCCSDGEVFGWEQTAYEIEILKDNEAHTEVFKVESAVSVLVPWPSCQQLDSRARHHVRVRCHGQSIVSGRPGKVNATDWSPSSTLEVALLRDDDWTARMITIPGPWPLSPDKSARPVHFHKTFRLPLNGWPISRARLYASSHGIYSAQINGKSTSSHCLAPGFQSYHKRLHYQIYDVTHLLSASESNKLDVEVAAGWFASAWSWAKERFVYGQRLGVLVQLEVYFADSLAPFVVNSDESWTVSTGALVSSELYNGEVCDLRLKMGVWLGYASLLPFFSVSKLVSPDAPPICVTQRLAPTDMYNSRSGNSVIVDFGQNIAGRIYVRCIKKAAGKTITFRHAEVLENGELSTRPLRTAQARDVLICDGSEVIGWHPKHTFHGFRYVEVTGWGLNDAECPLLAASLVAEVLHSNMSRTGEFSCSDEQVNRLHENSLWSMRSNFMSVPIECPSRDERMGWTGDLNIFLLTASFLYDTTGILRHWLEDLYLDQMEESTFWKQGVVPLFVPNCLLKRDQGGHGWDPMPNGVWGDAAIMVPWQLYCVSGDMDILWRQYDSMVQYLKHGVARDRDGLWSPEQWQFGDWLDPRAPQNDSGRGTTDGTFVADCFLVASTSIVTKVARILKLPTDAMRFEETANTLIQSWWAKYLTPAGLVVPDTATALSLAIILNLLPKSDEDRVRMQASARLSRIVRMNDFKITTGFVGTAFLARALTKTGNEDLAYAMLFQKQCPSYLYPVTMGATTTWERWDSMLPDGSVNSGSMTSFNHHALGSISNWLHADVGGLEAIEPGWKVFSAKPQPNCQLTWVETALESPYGRIELRWSLEEGAFCLKLQVPPNSYAVVHIPGDEVVSENTGQHGTVQRVGSGQYTWRSRFVQPSWPPKALLPPWGRAEF